MIKKILVFHYCGGFEEQSENIRNYTYDIGDVITVNSSKKFKLVKITNENNIIYYHFKEGKILYNFDWNE